MRRLVRFGAALLAILLVGYFVYAAALALRNFDAAPLMSPGFVVATVVMSVCYGFIIPTSAWAWQLLLGNMGEHQPVSRLIAIMAVSQFGKYLPGNVAHIAGRSALALTHGISGRALSASVAIETILALLACMAVGAFTFTISSYQPYQLALNLPGDGWWRLIAFGLAILLTAFLLGCRFKDGRTLAMRIPSSKTKKPEGRWKWSLRSLVLAFASYCANYLLIGVGLWAIAFSLKLDMDTDYWYLAGSFAFSWLVGFITPGAPAGLGVREGTMMLLLAGPGQQDAWLALVAASRVATLVADAFWFGIGIWFLRHRRTEGNVN